MLIKSEFLKIVRKKSALIVMGVSLLVTAFLFGLPSIQFQTYNQGGVLKGAEGIAYEKEQYSAISVPLSNETITETIIEVQKLFENTENIGYDGNEKFLIGDAYWESIAPRERLLKLIASTYANPNESVGYNKLPDLNLSSLPDFYQARNIKIEALLNTESRELSKEEKAYWQNMSNKIEVPLQYGYFEGWEVIISSFELLMFALLAICIMLAPVFSGEYQAGTDAVILSAKYGKTKLPTAKIIASLLFGLLAFTFHIIIAFGIPLFTFGVDGWNLPVQIAGTTVPYPLTFLQATLLNLGVVYLVLIAMIGLTLLLSSKMKSPYMVLTVLVPVLFIPIFLSPNGTTGIYNKILFLLPYRSTIPELSKYISYQFKDFVLDAFSLRIIIYASLSAISLPLARLGFKKHQVS